MLLDRTHRSWAFLSAVIFAVATASYVIYAGMSPRGPTGGSLMGLVYGTVGSAFMIFAGLLAGRKQVPFWRLGSAQFWLRGHLWLGTLSVPLILFHSGFGLGGVVEQLLWAFFGIVVLSGFFGLAMQHLLPRLLTSQVPRETFGAQIPYLRKRNRLLSDRLVSTICGRLPVQSDSLKPQLERLTGFAVELQAREKSARGKAEKDKVREHKATWTSLLNEEDSGLFRDLARFAKNSGWCRTENDFSTLLLDIYDFPGITPSETSPRDELPETASQTAPAASGGSGLSPLEQMKARQAAKGQSLSGEKAAGAKPLSPLDVIRKQKGAGSGSPEHGQAESESAAATPAGSPAALSPDDTASQPVVAKGAGRAGKAGRPSRKPAPAPVTVDDVDAEVAAVRQVLTEKYGYSDELADDAAKRTREFLQTPEQAQAAQQNAAHEKAAQQIQESASAVPAETDSDSKSAGGSGGSSQSASPLDLIRRSRTLPAGAKKAAPADKPAGASPLELLKAKPAARSGSGAAKPAVSKPPVPKKTSRKRELVRTAELRDFYLQTVRPFLAGSGREGRLADPVETSRAFTQMRATLPVELHTILETLQQYCQEHRQFSEQQRIHRWLHGWLALHIPFSIGLLVLFVFHVVMSLRVVPWHFPF